MSQVNLDFSSSCTLLDKGSLVSHNSQHVGRHSSLVSCHKNFCYGCFSRQVLKNLTLLHLTLCLLIDVCWTDKGSLPQSFRWWQGLWASTTRVDQECLKEWESWCACGGVWNSANSVPISADFWFTCSRLDWLGMQLVFIVLLFQPFWHLIILQASSSYHH